MKPKLPAAILLAPHVSKALAEKKPVVALESTVITHGLPYPQNLQLALDMESEVTRAGAVPVTVGVLDGSILVGLGHEQISRLASEKELSKISVRDFGVAIARQGSGGTTVAGTLAAIGPTGIEVFATGGIGGVHREAPFDVSADLVQLSKTPVVVVCAGAKAILDLSASLEVLETLGVPVIGYQCDELPAFYSRSSGLALNVRCDSPDEIAYIARRHWELGFSNAVLVTVPPPEDAALSPGIVEEAIQAALQEVRSRGIRGQAVTPYLLTRVSELTGGESLKANLALLLNNARVASQIAKFLADP